MKKMNNNKINKNNMMNKANYMIRKGNQNNINRNIKAKMKMQAILNNNNMNNKKTHNNYKNNKSRLQ